MLNQNVTPDFNALQNAFDASRTDSIDYFLFDLLYLAGHDLRDVPLHARRALLKQLVEAKDIERVHFSADFTGDPGSILASACAWGWKASSPSASTRPTCRPRADLAQAQMQRAPGVRDRRLHRPRGRRPWKSAACLLG